MPDGASGISDSDYDGQVTALRNRIKRGNRGTLFRVVLAVAVTALGMSPGTARAARTQPGARLDRANGAERAGRSGDGERVLRLRGEPYVRSRGDLEALSHRLKGSQVLSARGRLTWDLGGGVIDGRRATRFRREQDERNAGLNIALGNVTIRNGFIRDLWGGLIFRAGGGRVENLTWLNVGEDAVSTVIDRAPGFRAQGCTFHNDRRGDKTIQLNDAREARVENCTIQGGVTGIRWQDKDTRARGVDCFARGNRFIAVETAHHVGGRGTTLHLDADSEFYVRTRKRAVTSYGARIRIGIW